MGGGEKPERGVFRDLAVDHRHELVQARGMVEPRIEILEQALGDVAVHVELVDGAQQERLMHHRGKQAIGCMMAGDVENGDARLSLAALQMLDNFRSALGGSLANSRVEVVSFLEVNVDDVISADAAIQGNGAAIHVDSVKRRNLA